MKQIEDINEKIIKLQNENIVSLKEIIKAKDLIIKELKEQLMLGGVVGQSEQLVCRYCKTELNNPISKRAGYCDSWCVERDEAN